MTLKPDTADSRDYILAAGSVQLPKAVDLRTYAGAIEDQLNTNSCTANAGCSAAELFAARAGVVADFSRLFLYYNERQGTKFEGVDNGASMRDVCASLAKYGVCLESSWPFNPSAVNDQPTAKCYQEAASYKVGQYARVQEVDTTKIALAMGYPVIFGAYFFNGFRTLRGDAAAQQLQLAKYPSGESLGSHAMLLVGYDDTAGYFIVENSWGTSWGDNGYGYIPYEVFKNTTHDMWVFTEFAGLKPTPLFDPQHAPLAVTVSGRQTYQQPGTTATWRVNVAGGMAPYTLRTYSTTGGCTIEERDTDAPIVRMDAEDVVVTTVTDSSVIPQTVTIERKVTLAKPQAAPANDSDSDSNRPIKAVAAIAIIALLIAWQSGLI